jgi:hypothetical protein
MGAAENNTAAYVADRYARGLHGRVTSRDLREDYERWAAEHKTTPLGWRVLGPELRALGWVEADDRYGRGWLAPEPANDNSGETVRIGKAGAPGVVAMVTMWEEPQRGWRSCVLHVVREDAERLGTVAVPDLRTIAMRQASDVLWRAK